MAGIAESGMIPPMKHWEIVADKLSAAGWTWSYCSAVTRDGWRWIVDVHRGKIFATNLRDQASDKVIGARFTIVLPLKAAA